ncbi:MAG: hydantoinase B/oxoprolinase family protein, partial [Rhodobacteraceae bacterium]|nr:hydantoinase B/oxoprolinase family protein [Paracoccaceae bacterium]
RAPMMKINTVAAGGGSICTFDGVRLRVGPESAGADPGPACYRRGGPLTITDCNLLLGKIRPEAFPRTFGPNADQPLDERTPAALAANLAAEVSHAFQKSFSEAELAEGFIAIAVDNMARAIRKISVEAGHDVRDYALACFGGAGGQHACLVAEALGIPKVLIHPLAGVLSAYGIGMARQRVLKERTVRLPLDARHLDAIGGALDELANVAREALRESRAKASGTEITKTVHIRYPGSDTALPIAFGTIDDMRLEFAAAHRRRFGFVQATPELICELAEVEAIAAPDAPVITVESAAPASPQKGAHRRVRMFSRGAWHDMACADRADVKTGEILKGPAIITDDLATTVIEAGWICTAHANGELILEKDGASQSTAISTERDPVYVELFNNLFMSIAEQMGAVLQNTARSVNIKERLDFSCAVFDRNGNLIANAPHMPVHLGSMGDSVRAVIEKQAGKMRNGDSYVVNAPYSGGTHLPDITVVTPAFLPDKTEPAYFVASRGHHADIGGMTPGSM